MKTVSKIELKIRSCVTKNLKPRGVLGIIWCEFLKTAGQLWIPFFAIFLSFELIPEAKLIMTRKKWNEKKLYKQIISLVSNISTWIVLTVKILEKKLEIKLFPNRTLGYKISKEKMKRSSLEADLLNFDGGRGRGVGRFWKKPHIPSLLWNKKTILLDELYIMCRISTGKKYRPFLSVINKFLYWPNPSTHPPSKVKWSTPYRGSREQQGLMGINSLWFS